MGWYLAICVLMLYPWALTALGRRSGRNLEKIALLSACAVLLFFLALRDVSVGVDTKYYCHVFGQFQDISWGQAFSARLYATPERTWTFDFEPGYRLWNKLLSLFTAAPQAITAANGAVIIGLLYLLIRRDSPDGMMSIWLYITLGIFQTQMNVGRNAIAIFIGYLALGCIRERKPLQYVGLILLAASLHKSMIVFLPLYWVLGRPFPGFRFFWVCLGASVLIGLNFTWISPVLEQALPQELGRYFSAGNDRLETLLVGLFYAALAALVLLFLTKQERRAAMQSCSGGFWMLTMDLCLFGLNIGLGPAARMAALFGPYMILFLPQLVEAIPSQRRRRQAAVLVILLCGCQYVLRMMINNIGGSMPYRFFW